jgi:hypothetical protein
MFPKKAESAFALRFVVCFLRRVMDLTALRASSYPASLKLLNLRSRLSFQGATLLKLSLSTGRYAVSIAIAIAIAVRS